MEKVGEDGARRSRGAIVDGSSEATHVWESLPIQCQFCVGRTFRRSRFRPQDVKHLLLMRYPVRCLRCSQRQMVSFTVAGISVASKVRHSRPGRYRKSA